MIVPKNPFGVTKDIILTNDILRFENASLQKAVAREQGIVKQLESENLALKNRLEEFQAIVDNLALDLES